MVRIPGRSSGVDTDAAADQSLTVGRNSVAAASVAGAVAAGWGLVAHDTPSPPLPELILEVGEARAPRAEPRVELPRYS